MESVSGKEVMDAYSNESLEDQQEIKCNTTHEGTKIHRFLVGAERCVCRDRLNPKTKVNTQR